MNKKKLQTYYGTVAYKADKHPLKGHFMGVQRLMQRRNILHISLNMDRLKNVPTFTRYQAGLRSGCFCTNGHISQIRHTAPHTSCPSGGISFRHLETCFWWM